MCGLIKEEGHFGMSGNSNTINHYPSNETVIVKSIDMEILEVLKDIQKTNKLILCELEEIHEHIGNIENKSQ